MTTGEADNSSGDLDAKSEKKAGVPSSPEPASASEPKVEAKTESKPESESKPEPESKPASSKPKAAFTEVEEDAPRSDHNHERADDERIASVVDGPTSDTIPPRIVPRPISSSPIVITPDSFLPPPSGEKNAPPSAIIENAMTRGQPQTPISTIVGISLGVLAVIVLLALLLFR